MTEFEGYKGYCLKEKLKVVKNKIKEWSYKEFNQVELKIEAKKGSEKLDRKPKQVQLSNLEIVIPK